MPPMLFTAVLVLVLDTLSVWIAGTHLPLPQALESIYHVHLF